MKFPDRSNFVQLVVPFLLLTPTCFGVTITETRTLDFDVLSPDLSTVICSTRDGANCSAFRPLFDLERRLTPDSGANLTLTQTDLSLGNSRLFFSFGELYIVTNLTDDYGFRISLSYEAEVSGLFRFRGRTGSGDLSWRYSKGNIYENLSNAEDTPNVDLFPTDIALSSTLSAPVPTDFDSPFALTFSTFYTATDTILPPGLQVGEKYAVGFLEIEPYEVDGVFDDNLVIEEVLPIPEPSTAVLLIAGLAGIALRKRLRASAG